MRPEPSTPDNRKQAFYAEMGAFASRAEVRSVGFKQVDLWKQMFPQMFDWLDTTIPTVSPQSGQRLTLVYNCLNVLGETRGALPFCLKRYVKGKGSEEAYDHPVYKLIHDRPNAYQTSYDFWSTKEKLKHIHGNAYALIDRDIYGDPVALYLIPPDEVAINQTESGEVYYKWFDRVIRSTDILHFKNYSTNGLEGISTIKANSLTIGLGLKLKQYNSSLIGNRTHGYLTGPKPKDELQKGQIKGTWNKQHSPEGQSGSLKAETIKTQSFGDIPYLYGGVEFHALTLPADQAAYIESSQLNDRDILGMFRMPPTMVSIYKDAPYNSSEQQDIQFVKYTLASIRQDEQECDYKLLPTGNRTYYCKYSLNGILRGDMKTRREFYAAGIGTGWMTPRMAAEFEDLQWLGGPEGDKYYMQGNMIPMDLLEKFVMSKAAQQTNQPDNQKSEEDVRSEIKAELREVLQGKLNGHYKDVAKLLE